MTAPWRKAVRDFWQERTRTVLVVLAIALGIVGFVGVLSAYAVLTRELDRGYLATDPASATLRTDMVDDELVRSVLADPEVSDAEPRRTVSARIKTGPAEWRNIIFFVVKDYGNIRLSKLVPQKGAWPPATGELLIERDAFQVAHTSIGRTVTVRSSEGNEHSLLVSGSVHDVGQAQARMENLVYAYITVDTLSLLDESPYLDQINIQVAQDKFNEAHVRQVADDVKKLLEAKGHPVRRVDVPRPGKHPHSDLMGSFLLAMSTFGLLVLVLSGVIVVNLLTALMSSQVRQIGVMKTVGGTRWQIAQIYLGQSMLLGVGAFVVAMPLGLLLGRALCDYMAVFLNFDITSYAVPLWVYLAGAAVGLLVPLAAAFRPVWNGTAVTVREALVEYGVSGSGFGSHWLDLVLAGIGGRSRPIVLAVRNSFRRRSRFVLTLVTLATAGTFFMSALSIRSSMINTLDRMFAGKKYDLTIVLAGIYPIEKIETAVKNTPGIRDYEAWFTTEASLPKTSGPAAAPAALPQTGNHSGGGAAAMHGGGGTVAGDRFATIALPAKTRLLDLEIVEGRAFNSEDEDSIVINTSLAAKSLLMKVGNTVTLNMGPAVTSWHIVGLSREPFSQPLVYIPQKFIDKRHPGQFNSLRLVLDKNDAASINAIRATLEQQLDKAGLHTAGGLTKADSRTGFDQHMLMIYVLLVIMSGIIGTVGGLGLMTTMDLNVRERRREMGTLRAIGATPRMVWLMIISEGAVMGLLSWLAALVAAVPLSRALGNAIVNVLFQAQLDFTFPPGAPLFWLAISLALAVASSFLPAWSASRATVREALAYE